MVFSHENQDSKGGRFAVVGSFKSSSSRRVCCPDGVFHAMKSGPVVNKHLHWYSGCSSEYLFRISLHTFLSNTIMYFNIQMNEFHEVPMPEPPMDVMLGVRSKDQTLGLGVLDGCLCMLHRYSINHNVEVFAMKENGIRESWTTMFIIPNLTLGGIARNLELFGYTKRGEVLMKVLVGDMRCEMTTYNPIDRSRRNFLTQDDCKYVNAVMYEEITVTPTDYGWKDKDSREATYVEYFIHRSPQKMRKRWDGIWQVCTMKSAL
ncbi:uncharacterized protein LOC131316058 [Rhododendron vialii]|uniref:uncharacterized protein LOC131316058 n=1 Tax=Rhododendron vialii TaxID=182163 RepID=UPI00265F1462|nr:uncharacterized protein LOC131316058 [Rhododendron vialii]